jgi:hypothetical protein
MGVHIWHVILREGTKYEGIGEQVAVQNIWA